MNRDAMLAPFAEEELHSFEGRGKQTMTYIEDETVMDRLDLGYGPGNWQLQVDAVSESVVKVRLGVREHAEWVWYEDFGYPNRDGGESLKEAVSDGIRRCGRFVGIARDLYRKAPDERRTDYGPPPTPASVNAQERERLASATYVGPLPEDNGLIGTAIAQGTQDFELRQSPDGYTLPFRVKNGSKSFIVLAEGKLAQALEVIKPRVIGQRVTVWGHWTDETIPAKGTKPEIRYRVLHLERIETPDGTLPPADDALANTATGHEHVDDEMLEAETTPLFTGPEFDKVTADATS